MRAPTLLTPDRLSHILAERYAIHDFVDAVEIPGASTAHVWKIGTNSGESYVLKEFTPTFSLERVSHEPGVVNFLRDNKLPVGMFLPTLTGEITWMLEDRPVNLQEFLFGDSTPQCEAPEWLLRQSVGLLGNIHRSLSDYPALSARFDAAWFIKRHDLPKQREKMEHLIETARLVPENAQIVDDLQWKISRLESAQDIDFDLKAFTVGNTHGDYNVANILTDKEKIVGVIDFSNACRMPLIWDIFRSYTLGSSECAEATINLDGLRAYAADYLKVAPLSQYDLRMAGSLMYFEAVHSLFGYREYLLEQADNWQALIGYASWHIQLAKWIEKNQAALSEALMSAQE